MAEPLAGMAAHPAADTHTTAPAPHFPFDNRFARDMAGFYAPVQPEAVPRPVLLKLNRALATDLGLDADALDSAAGAAIFAGNQVPEGATPLAQAYAGHQFGGFSPQLGDGRALLLGEVVDRFGQRRDIALKGSGRTPFSRSGDGKAALGPVLREYLMGEAMHALGIPTTRALAAATTGEQVYRERPLPGAVLTRVAASHIRVGTFQFFAARGRHDDVRRLVHHVIQRHYPELAASPQPALALLQAVAERQAALIARWMGVGFIHGVMNTDNMTLSGETIDYGPCAFMEHTDAAAVFSSIDHHGRYAYGQQPLIARWNIARLAECLLPLMGDDEAQAVTDATAVIDAFPALYQAQWLKVMRAKLGLAAAAGVAARGAAHVGSVAHVSGNDAADQALAEDFLAVLETQHADFTLAFRHLAEAAEGQATSLKALLAEPAALDGWLLRWHARAAHDALPPAQHAQALRRANPLYIPRNHQVEAALAAAVERGDLDPFNRLLAALLQPFDERPGLAAYAEPAPASQTASYRTFCGT